MVNKLREYDWTILGWGLAVPNIFGLGMLYEYYTELPNEVKLGILLMIVFYTMAITVVILDNKDLAREIAFMNKKMWDHNATLDHHHRRLECIHDILDQIATTTAAKISPCPIKIGDVILIKHYRWWEDFDYNINYTYSNIHTVREQCNVIRPYKAIIDYITYNIEYKSWVLHVSDTGHQHRILLKGLKYKKLYTSSQKGTEH